MELLLSSAIGVLTAAGIYLILRLRSFPVVVGTAMLSYAVNLFLFSSGRLALDMPPILETGRAGFSDPLPQALVLTAIVISFGMTAVVVLIALGSFLEGNTDIVDMNEAAERLEPTPPEDKPNPDLADHDGPEPHLDEAPATADPAEGTQR